MQGLSLLKYAFFRWLAASFSVKGQTSLLIDVVESFRQATAREYKLAQENRAYKRFLFQIADKGLFSPEGGRIALSANVRIAEFLDFAIQAKFAYVNKLRGLSPLF